MNEFTKKKEYIIQELTDNIGHSSKYRTDFFNSVIEKISKLNNFREVEKEYDIVNNKYNTYAGSSIAAAELLSYREILSHFFNNENGNNKSDNITQIINDTWISKIKNKLFNI